MKKAETVQDPAIRGVVYGGLCRLYHEEAPWDGKVVGTRPDTRGPYYKPVDWDGTTRIGAGAVQRFQQGKGRCDSLPGLRSPAQRRRFDRHLRYGGQGRRRRSGHPRHRRRYPG